MTRILYFTHSGARWLVVLAIVIALGYMLYSLVTNREQSRITRIVMVTFSSLVGLQWIIGLVYYLLYGNQLGSYTRTGWTLHLTSMTVALITAHLYLPFRRRASTRTYYIASVAVLVVTSALIWYGVAVLLGTVGSRWQFGGLYPPPPTS
jgi:glucose uptake protein GlcU